MSISDITFSFLLTTFVFMAFVGGCDRFRLSCLEDDSREYRKRISELEINVMYLEKRERRTK